MVGGGAVALRKVQSLLEQGAEVTVISPVLCEELKALEDQFVWMKSVYKEGQLEGSFLVIAATDARAVNHDIAQWCEENQVLVNVADSREESSFLVNAAVRQGDLLIGISTGGTVRLFRAPSGSSWNSSSGRSMAGCWKFWPMCVNQAMEQITDEAKRRQFLQSVADMDLPGLLRQKQKRKYKKG